MGRRTILVTGSAGFIGSHTVEKLLARGDFVVGLDNFNSYYAPSQKEQNIEGFLAHPRFTLYRGDVRDERLVSEIFANHSFDAVIHLAAMAGVRVSVDEPSHYYDVNLMGSILLLEAARKQNLPNFVFGSTSSVYGRTDKIPFVETDGADRPLAPYPASKRSVELLGHSHHHMHGLDFTAVRFFTVYGARNRHDMLPFLAMEHLRKGAKLTLFNGGAMHRDWTYVSDIADGLVAAADRRLGYEVINLGRGEPVELLLFVQKLHGLAGGRLSFESHPMLAADILYTYANIEKAKRLLDYRPKVSVDEGIQLFFDWYESHAL